MTADDPNELGTPTTMTRREVLGFACTMLLVVVCGNLVHRALATMLAVGRPVASVAVGVIVEVR